MSEYTAAIKARAAELGFDACGVAAAGNADPEDRLGRWLEQGYHAGMAWLAARKEVRQDVRLKLPGARSVVVVARNYFAPLRERPRADAGRVARYAWGRDYHDALEAPIAALAETIRGLADGVETYCSVDTGPVLERAWAVRAGIGWRGKSGMVIRPGLGSYFFLGAIVTTLEVEPDEPMEDRCESCTLCIESCPTRAIVEPGVLDARRCISYHTIENRGDIPEDVCRKMGGWVFGCDLCIDVCPWNTAAAPTTEPAFQPIEGNAQLDLDGLERMDEAAFAARFAGSPIRRAKCAGMKRNAAIVRENLRRLWD